ncbi:MFS transporter, partial [Turicibacter sanguinis]|nr:MFS transporter [Turicibacter sanguinis]
MDLIRQNKNFRLVFLGALVSSVGDVLFNFAIGLYILELTHSAFMLSLYGTIGGVTWLLLAPFGGVMVDRIPRVKVIYFTDFIRGINILLCGLVMLTVDHVNIIMACLCLSSVISSINGALFGPASQAIIPLTVEEEQLVKANSLMSLMYGIKDVFGMLLAGILYSWLGPIVIIFINGFSFIMSGITELFIKLDESELLKRAQESHVLTDLKEGCRYILCQNKAILWLLIILNFKNLALGPIQSVLVPYLMNEHLHVNEMYLSALYVAMALGGILGSLWVSKEKVLKTNETIKKSLWTLIICVGIQWALFELLELGRIPYLGFFLFLFILFIISGAINVLLYVPVMASLQRVVS